MGTLVIFGFKHPQHSFFELKEITKNLTDYRDLIYIMCLFMGQIMRKKRIVELIDEIRTFEELSFREEVTTFLGQIISVNMVVFQQDLSLMTTFLEVFASNPVAKAYLDYFKSSQRNTNGTQLLEGTISPLKYKNVTFERNEFSINAFLRKWNLQNAKTIDQKVSMLLSMIKKFIYPIYKARFCKRCSQLIDIEIHRSILEFYTNLMNLKPKINISTVKQIEISLFWFLDFKTHLENKISFEKYDSLAPHQYFSFVNFQARRLTNNRSKIDSYADDQDNFEDLSLEMSKLMSNEQFYLNRCDSNLTRIYRPEQLSSQEDHLQMRRFNFLMNFYNCKIGNIMEAMSGIWTMETLRISPGIEKMLSKNATVLGKVKKTDVITFLFCIATIQSLGGIGAVSNTERQRSGGKFPTGTFSRKVSIMSKKFSTKLLFRLNWGRKAFVEWCMARFKGSFKFIYIILFLIDLLLKKKNQMVFKLVDEDLERYREVIEEYCQKFIDKKK